MKNTILFAALAIGACSLFSAEFQLENKTPLKIVSIQTESSPEIAVAIGAGKSKKVSIPAKYDDDTAVIVHFEDGREAAIDDPGSLRSASIELIEKFSFSAFSRKRHPEYSANQLKISCSKKITAIYYAPINSDNWQQLAPTDAKKELYQLPGTEKFQLKIKTKVKSCPERIFSFKGQGYDLSEISVISIKYNDFQVTTKNK